MITAVVNLLSSIIYPIFGTLLVVVNLFELMFKGFAGTGDIFYSNNGGLFGISGSRTITNDNTGAEGDTGILYFLMNSAVVKDLLISMAILGLFLIIIFTAMAFIKNMYADKPKSWQDIVGSAIKGLMNFVFLPVCCLLGVWAGNILLNAINSATSTSESTSFAGKVFITASYDANRIRRQIGNDLDDDGNLTNVSYKDLGGYLWKDSVESLIKKYTGVTLTADMDAYEAADLLDEAFVKKTAKYPVLYMTFSGVSPYYEVFNLNYLVLGTGAIFTIIALISLTYGVIKRLFILLMLYVISPALCAMYPLDDGNAAKAWKKDFTKNVLSAYSAVAGMNIYFSIAPLINKIRILPDGGILESIVQIVLLIVGLFCVKEFIGLIAGYIGAGNALADGEGIKSKVKDSVKKNAGKVIKGGIKTGVFVGKRFAYRGRRIKARIDKYNADAETHNKFEAEARKAGLAAIGNKPYEERTSDEERQRIDAERKYKREHKDEYEKEYAEHKEQYDKKIGAAKDKRGDFATYGNVALDAWNFVNKKTADSVGLKSKDVDKYNVEKKWFENTAVGQILAEAGDKDKENKTKRDEAALKAEKKAYLKRIKGVNEENKLLVEGEDDPVKMLDYIEGSGGMVSAQDIIATLNDKGVKGTNKLVNTQIKQETTEAERKSQEDVAEINAKANKKEGVTTTLDEATMLAFKGKMVEALKDVMGGGAGGETQTNIKGGTVSINQQQLNNLNNTINGIKNTLNSQVGEARNANESMKSLASKLDEVSKTLKSGDSSPSGKDNSADMKKIAELLKQILDMLK